MAGNSNSGRRPKSTAHLQLHGGYRADRHGNRVDSKAAGRPERPKGLSKPAQWLWDLVVNELAALGVVKKLDTAHLWSMCEMWGLYRESMKLALAAPTNKDARIAAVSYLAAFEAAAAKCGLTPADRAKLTATPEQQADPFEEFLKKKA